VYLGLLNFLQVKSKWKRTNCGEIKSIINPF